MESSVRKRGPSEDGSLECEAKRCKTEDDEETFIVAMREFSIEDVDFSDLNDDGLVNSLRCGICTDVTIHPHMISECQHTFCKECIEIHCKDATKNHTCPSCRGAFSAGSTVFNRLQASIVDNLQIACLSKDCDWRGKFQNLRHHMREACQQLRLCDCGKITERTERERHERSCRFVKIQCHCGEWIERGKLQDHESDECPKRTMQCEMEMHGCMWQGSRQDYHQTHSSSCLVRKLFREVMQLKSYHSEDRISKLYRKSDCFTVTGLVGEPASRRELLTSLVRSKLDLHFPIKMGRDGEDYTICITAVETSGIFDIDPKKTSNKCMVDIDLQQGILAITFAGNKDRLFVIPTSSAHPTVKKQKGGRITVQFSMPSNRLVPSPVVYAHREWLQFKQDAEYPFTLEPSSRLIKQFNLHNDKGKVDNDALHVALKEFFNLTGWGE